MRKSDRSPLLVMGPCSLESREIAMKTADSISRLLKDLSVDVEWIFKGSFLKDNRTSSDGYRGPGLHEGLAILEEIGDAFGVKTLTDVHLPGHADEVSEVADVIQVPAFLCRQTSLLEAAGSVGLPVNVKKGQFMAPVNMKGAVEKAASKGCPEVWLTERGTFFGYGDLVVDFRSLSIMRKIADRVILDVTHSLQRPGAAGNGSGGTREYALQLARAGAAWGVDGLFIEVHPDPDSALSDSAVMLDPPALEKVLHAALEHWEGT